MEQKGIIGFFKRIFGQDKQPEVSPAPAELMAELRNWKPLDGISPYTAMIEREWKARQRDDWEASVEDDRLDELKAGEATWKWEMQKVRDLIERRSPFTEMIEDAWKKKDLDFLDTLVKVEDVWAVDMVNEALEKQCLDEELDKILDQAPPITLDSVVRSNFLSPESKDLLKTEYRASREMIAALGWIKLSEAGLQKSVSESVRLGDKLATANNVDRLFKNFVNQSQAAEISLSQDEIELFAANSQLAIEKAQVMANENLSSEERTAQLQEIGNRHFLLGPEEKNLLTPEAKQMLKEKFASGEELIAALDRARESNDYKYGGKDLINIFNTAVNLYNKYGFDCDEVYWYPLDGALNHLIDSVAFHEKEKFAAIGFDDDKIAAFREQITQTVEQEKKAPLLSISEKGWNMLGEMTSHADDLKDFLGEPHSLEAGKLLVETGSKLTECLNNEDYSGAKKCGTQLLGEYFNKLYSWLDKEKYAMDEEYGPNNWCDHKFQHKEWILKSLGEELSRIQEEIEKFEEHERFQASQNTAPEPLQPRKAPMLSDQPHIQTPMKIREAPMLAQADEAPSQTATHSRSAGMPLR